MKRKRLGFFYHLKSAIYSLLGDKPRPNSPDSNDRQKKRPRFRFASPEHERRVPVYREGRLVEYQIVGSETEEGSEEWGGIEEREAHVHGQDSTGYSPRSSTTARSNEDEGKPQESGQPTLASNMETQEGWNGLPGYPSNNPAIIHNFTWEEYLAMGNQILIHWSHNNRSRKVGSINAEIPDKGKLSFIYCLGLYVCTGTKDGKKCIFQERPKARSKALRDKQLETNCTICGGKKEHIKCPVSCEIRQWKGGVRVSNTLPHTHPDPAYRLHASSKEDQDFGDMVEEHPDLTAIQLANGVPGLTGPGKKVSDISPIYKNMGVIRRKRRQILYKTVGTGKEDTFFAGLYKLRQKCKGFVRRQVIAEEGNVTVICFQTNYMRSQLVKTAIINEPVNGILTDGAHKYFKHAILIVSSAYGFEVSRWVPALFSYSNGASAAHYKIHFLTLFEGIAAEAQKQKIVLDDDLFAGVVDFSDAQRLGFVHAFVEFWRSQQGNSRSKGVLELAASACLRGCFYHWQKSVTRMSRIGLVISPERVNEFKQCTSALFSAKNDQEFLKLSSALLERFPTIEPWLVWWLKPSHAAMLFPSQKKMDSEIWDSLPSTTNAEESIHNHLYQAQGNKHGFFKGSYGLYGYALFLESEFNAEIQGVRTRYGAREPHKNRAAKYGKTKPPKKHPSVSNISEEKDDRGRGPDTAAELAPRSRKRVSTRRIQETRTFDEKVQLKTKSKRKSKPRPKKLKTLVKKPLKVSQHSSSSTGTALSEDSALERDLPVVIPFYWINNNTCWLDSSLSLLYTALKVDWEEFDIVSSSARGTQLMTVFEALHARQRLLVGRKTGGESIIEVLGHQRDVLRHELDQQGALDRKSKFGYQPLWTWLSHMLKKVPDDAPIPFYPCAYFEFLQTELHICNGSGDSELDGRHVELVHPRRRFLHQLNAEDHIKHAGNVTSWFQSFMSLDRQPVWAEHGCWKTREGKRLCLGTRLDRKNLILSIPVILVIEMADDLHTDMSPWDLPEQLCPTSSRKDLDDKIYYELIGIGMHSDSDSHFTSRFVEQDGTVYAYNDFANKGYAIPIPDASRASHLAGNDIALPPSYKVCCGVYRLYDGKSAQTTFFRRRKAALETYHNIRCLEDDLGKLPTLEYVDPAFKKMEPVDRKWLTSPLGRRTSEYVLECETEMERPKRKLSPDMLSDGSSSYYPTPSVTTASDSGSDFSLGITPRKSQDNSERAQDQPKTPPYRMIKAPPPERPQGSVQDTPSSNMSGSNDSDFMIRCVCGVHGDGNLLYRGQIEGLVVRCDHCAKWVHIACQRDGRADGLTEQMMFLCDECNPEVVEFTRQKRLEEERKELQKWKTLHDLPPLVKRLKAGKGALVFYRKFWYPARLIWKSGNQWTVKWWRGCKFDSPDIQPGSVTTVPSDHVVDGLWLDRLYRRSIQLGEWTHPSYGDDDDMDEISKFPYTDDIHNALIPYQDLLEQLFHSPETISANEIIPARDYVQMKLKQRKPTDAGTKDWVEFVGGVSIMKQAAIGNWFETHISIDPKLRPLWRGRTPFAHAITLYLARQMYLQAADEEKVKDRVVSDFLEKAWELQKSNTNPEDSSLKQKVVDVDAECLRQLEKCMFERSGLAGLAGYYQWGLNAGSHQNGWDPYEGTPEEWDRAHEYEPWSDSELEPGPDFTKIEVSPDNAQPDSKSKSRPKPRPKKREQPIEPNPMENTKDSEADAPLDAPQNHRRSSRLSRK